MSSMYTKNTFHKQHRQEKSRKKWESHKKASGRESSKSDHCGDSSVFRGKDAVEFMMTELQTFYSEHAKLDCPETAKVYESLASSISREARNFNHAPADVAVPEPHPSGLTGHGMLIEFCTSPDSMVGRVGKDLGAQVIRCTETHMNVEHHTTMDILIKIAESNPGVDLWGSLPCGPWSQWQ